MQTKGSARAYYLDWLRVLGTLAVLVYHSTRFFNPEEWHVKNPVWYPWVQVWNDFAVTWLMPLMFAISGASLFYALGKGGGAGKFVKDKVLRLLVPLLVGALTHASLQVYLERLTHGQFSGTYFQFLPHYFQGVYDGDDPSAGNFAVTAMHLWYLFWLFLFTLVLYPLLRWLRGRGHKVLAWIGNQLARPGAIYLLALPNMLLPALVSPDSLVMDMNEGGWALVLYLWLLLAGFLAVSHERLVAVTRRLRWLSLALAVGSTATFLVVAYRFGPVTFGTAKWALVLGLRGLGCWTWLLAFMGLAMHYLERRTPFLAYANEAVLPFYILHQTVLLCVGYFVVQWPIPSLLRWAIILPVSFALIMLLYEFVVRRFGVMRFLFGMKPKPRPPVAQAAAAPAGGASE